MESANHCSNEIKNSQQMKFTDECTSSSSSPDSPLAKSFDITNIRPTPNAIRVLNLSPAASEKAVKEFFTFCGPIVHFQMISTTLNTKEALIMFDRESAANTSLLLTNAVIVDRSVIVRPFFDAHDVRDPIATVEANERDAAAGKLDGHKPLTRVVAELLASGYTLTEAIVKKGLEVDNKYSVSKTLSAFLVSAQARALALDQKYRVTGMLRDINARLHISEGATAAIAKASEIGERALNTSAGQLVKGKVVSACDTAFAVASETLLIVDQRRSININATDNLSDKEFVDSEGVKSSNSTTPKTSSSTDSPLTAQAASSPPKGVMES